jgi:glutathione S-transferase
MLKVWGRPNSINVQKVMWLIGELGLAHEHIPAGGSFGGLAEPRFLRLNPHGLVPVLEDGVLAVWESHAILRYLAATYGGDAFWPPANARARQDGWMDWTLSAWQPAFVTGVFWGYYRTPEEDRDWPAIRRSLKLCSDLLGRVEAQLEDGGFLTGPTLALGDIPLATSLFRWFELDIERPRLPKLELWYERLQARPAYRDHVMVAFDDLKGRLAF